MSTVTDSSVIPNEPPVPALGIHESSHAVHLADAEKVFAKTTAAEKPAEKPGASSGADAEKPAGSGAASGSVATAASAASDKLASVIKLPGAKSSSSAVAGAGAGATSTVDTATPADAAGAIEDIAKDLTPPDEKSKSFAGWKELKTRAQAAAEKAAKLERDLAEVRKVAETAKAAAPVDDATRARLAELEQQNKTYSERLKVLDLRSHPEFVSKFVTPQEQARAQLAQLAQTEEVALNLDTLLSLSGKKFNVAVSEALDAFTPYGRVKFQATLDHLLAARLGAEQALAQADESLKSFSQTGGARSREAFDRTAQNYQGVYIPITPDDKADDAIKTAAAAYNADLAAVSRTAEQYAFGALDEAKAADLAHKAALFDFTVTRGIPRIADLYGAELTAKASRIAELEKQVRELTVASPSVSGGAGGSGAGGAGGRG
jgi:hypothetical protein